METLEGLYKAVFSVQSAYAATAADANLWHNRLCHIRTDTIKQFDGLLYGFSDTIGDENVCLCC